MQSQCLESQSAGISLEQLSVLVPCTVAWESMTGNRQIRHCDQCRQQVYNLSEMSREAADEFLQAHSMKVADGQAELRLCVRFYRRPDGTVTTRDCFSLRRAAGRGAMWMFGVAAGLVLLALGVFGLTRKSDGSTLTSVHLWPRLCEHEPFRTLFGGQTSTMIMGEIAPIQGKLVAPPMGNASPAQSGSEAN